jgi:hypothetical protein
MNQTYNRIKWLITIYFICLLPANLFATIYYVSAEGNDSNNGTSILTSWKTLSKVSTTTFSPGDQILFNSGDTFIGQLIINSSGSAGTPIVYGKYGTGAAPYLAAQGVTSSTVYSFNKGYFELNDLKITNYLPGNDINNSSAARLRGVHIVNQDAGTINYIHLNRLEVTGVNSEHASFTSRYYGGIFFEITGSATPSKWNDILVSGCNIHDLSRTGLNWNSSWDTRSSYSTFGTSAGGGTIDNWVPSTNVIIRDNRFEHITGNGFIIRTATYGLAEGNYFNYCGEQISGNAAFCFNTDYFTFQYNEALNTIFNTGDTDARGFDSDFQNKNTIVQYNYLHDNGKGGFVGTGGAEDGTGNENFNTGLLVRYNILEDNKQSGIVLSGNLWNATIHNNVVYANASITNVMIVDLHAWVVDPHDVKFYNNIFMVKGSGANYSYENAKNITFSNNLYSSTSPAGLPVVGYNNFANIIEDNAAVIGNPLFTTEALGDAGYKLQLGSPAFGKGKVITQPTLDYYNNTIGANNNIGADQTPAPPVSLFEVDINHTNGITKPGFTGLVGTEGNSVTVSGTKFTMFGGIDGTRDRGTAGEVTRDFAFNDGVSAGVGFRMENIPAGTYDVNTWHYDPGYPGLINVEFREKGNTATTQVKVTNHSLTNSASTSFQIVVEAGKDYEIITRENSAEDRTRFNGIRLNRVAGAAARTTNFSANNETSSIAMEDISKKNDNLIIYPNPVTDNFTIAKKIDKDDLLKVTITNIKKQKMYSSEQSVKKGSWELKLNKNELRLQRGVYAVSVVSKYNGTFTGRILVF